MGKPLIVAIDDERAILAMLSMALSAAGYEVSTAGTVAELRALDTSRAEIFIVDLSLPDGNGLALVKEFQSKPACGVIILSGRAGETDQVLGLELGADDYVTKPFRMRELVARVNAVHRRIARSTDIGAGGNGAKDAADLIDVSFDGYKISFQARRVWGPGGDEIALTTAELDLLMALLRRRGAVLNRDQIMAQMKGRDWVASDRAVDGLVSRLRRKLPAVAPRTTPYIRTVHGSGYAFVG